MRQPCSKCEKEFEHIELVTFGNEMLCLNCKEYAMQRLREGVGNNALNPQETTGDIIFRFLFGLFLGVGMVAVIILLLLLFVLV